MLFAVRNVTSGGLEGGQKKIYGLAIARHILWPSHKYNNSTTGHSTE